jgi:photosystem II stability/assembly factor-like uncharacterized protein
MMNTALVMPERLHNRMEGFLHSWGCFRLFLLALFLCYPSIGHGGWVRQTSNTTLQLRDVCFVDSLYGWAVGGNLVGPDSTFLVALRTTDGGTTWLKTWEASGLGLLKTVTFVSRLHGWAMGDSTLTVESTDGGISWNNLPIIAFTFVPFAERFVNDTFGYALGGIANMGLLDWSNIWWTTNGGLTWTMRPSFSPRWLIGLDIKGPRWAWATGQRDSMVLTRNAAASWLTNYLPDSVSFTQGVAFGDTAVGVAVCYRLLSRTTDGGLTWVQRSNPFRQYFSSAAATMPDTGHAWACGTGGTIIASSDGGINWVAQVTGTSVMLKKIWFINERQGWAVGDSGVILHTEDGGRSGVWQDFQGCFQPLTSNLSFSVVPNPFTSFATLPGHEAERFNLYDISGRKVGTYRGDRIGFGLSAGVYFLRPQEGNAKPVRVVKVR